MHIRVLQLNNITPVLESSQAWIAIQMKLIKKSSTCKEFPALPCRRGFLLLQARVHLALPTKKLRRITFISLGG